MKNSFDDADNDLCNEIVALGLSTGFANVRLFVMQRDKGQISGHTKLISSRTEREAFEKLCGSAGPTSQWKLPTVSCKWKSELQLKAFTLTRHPVSGFISTIGLIIHTKRTLKFHRNFENVNRHIILESIGRKRPSSTNEK